MGSMLFWGEAPWPPFPSMWRAKRSKDAVLAPRVQLSQPTGRWVATWRARAASTPSSTPSSTMVRAPEAVSSAAWNIRTTWPSRASSRSFSSRAAPRSMAVCRSWPQAWAAPFSAAKGRPLSSAMGRASMSARRRRVRPSARPSRAVRPPPRARMSRQPAAERAADTRSRVCVRSKPSSGQRWRERRRAVSSSAMARARAR